MVMEWNPWRRDFPYPSRWTLRFTQPPLQWILGYFTCGKAAKA